MILNADDFGYSAEVNAAIVEAVERELVTSTSLMPNREGFAEACALAGERDLAGRVGVHFVLTEGEPLTEPIRTCTRFCDAEGQFFEWRATRRIYRLDRRERDAVAAELRAQIERCRRNGIDPGHLDSHHHVHNEWAIGRIVIHLARELRIGRVRLARNCGPGISVVDSGYKKVYNRRLRRAGLAGTRWFGDVDDWIHLRSSGADAASLADFEVMLHPVHERDGRLVDGWLAHRALAELLRPILG